MLQFRIIVVQISLHLIAAAMENDLPSHHIADISLCIFGGCEITFHAMNPLTNDDGNLTCPLVQYNYIHRLFAFCINDCDLFVIHGVDSKGIR